ncbi:MAG: ATP-binding cassette domain-containing protein [Erysipelothrix sp.]
MIILENAIKNRRNLEISIDYLEIPKGMVTMIVSRNSGGKSTLLKVLSGALKLNEGKYLIDTQSIDEYKKNNTVFYMPDSVPVAPQKSVFSSTSLFEGVYEGFASRQFEKNLIEANIPMHSRIRELSKGQQKKYMFELLKLSNAKMLLLDEPTNGLDENNKTEFKKIIQNYLLNDDNYVVIASNNVEDIENICDNLVYIKNGKVFFEGSVLDLQDRYKLWTGPKDKIPTHGVVGVRKKRNTADALIDITLNTVIEVNEINLHDLLIMLERGTA